LAAKLGLVAIAVLAAAAVAGVAFLSQPTTTVPTTSTTTIATTTTQPPSMTTTTTARAIPQWMQVTLKDPRTGQTFRISDFEGKVVVLEIMAIWCPVCVDQGSEIQKVINGLSAEVKDRVVFISVDVDPNENEANLATYADSLKRTWPFAYDSTGEFFKTFIRDRGTTVRSEMPAVPIYIIALDGSISRMPGGPYEVKSPSLILSWINSALS